MTASARDVLNVALVERLVERRGGRVYSAAGEGTDDDGPTGQLMRTMVDAFAAYERAHHSRPYQVGDGRGQGTQGRRVGCIPWGHRVGGDGRTLEPNADERATLAEIRKLRARGYALVTICDELNAARPAQPAGPIRGGRAFVAQLLSRHPS